MNKIADTQKTEKKKPIILKDPTESYHPGGKKTSLPTATATPISGGASIFGKNISLKIKESVSKPEEPEKSETKETDKNDGNKRTEKTETETESSPENAGEKVNFDKLSKTQFKMR